MCRYAMVPYKVHYVCLQCRKCFKYPWDSAVHPCPDCTAPMINAGHDFAAPRRNDKKGWAVVAAVLNAGLRYEGFEGCGCLHEPKFRPRTGAQARARRRIAARTGTEEATALAARDPDSLENSVTS